MSRGYFINCKVVRGSANRLHDEDGTFLSYSFPAGTIISYAGYAGKRMYVVLTHVSEVGGSDVQLRDYESEIDLRLPRDSVKCGNYYTYAKELSNVIKKYVGEKYVGGKK